MNELRSGGEVLGTLHAAHTDARLGTWCGTPPPTTTGHGAMGFPLVTCALRQAFHVPPSAMKQWGFLMVACTFVPSISWKVNDHEALGFRNDTCHFGFTFHGPRSCTHHWTCQLSLSGETAAKQIPHRLIRRI